MTRPDQPEKKECSCGTSVYCWVHRMPGIDRPADTNKTVEEDIPFVAGGEQFPDSGLLHDENKRLREALVAMCEWWDQDDGLLSEFDSQRLFKARELAEKALGGK